jgi:hypothetical protein
MFSKKEASMRRPKMLTTTITRSAFAEKMKQVAESEYFYEYKCINDFWTCRIEGVKLPAEIVFLVGQSPYRFTAISIDRVEISTIPEYAREILSKISCPGDGLVYVYSIKCKPIIVPRGAVSAKQLQLGAFAPIPIEPSDTETAPC